ncbi:hypothetical protein SUDANB95_02383 [Actinosynnema sp. ALI-1.44]
MGGGRWVAVLVGVLVVVPGVASADEGEITFGPPTTVYAGYGSYGITAGDFNGDGRPDLVVANRNEAALAVLLGDGAGGFTLRKEHTREQTWVPAAADFDRDGKADLAVADDRGELVLFTGRGDGTFVERAKHVLGGGYGQVIVIGDLDGDTDPDIAVGSSSGGAKPAVTVLLNDGTGAFTRIAAAGFGTYSDTLVGLALDDLDRDGEPDLVAVTTTELWVLSGRGDGTFGAAGTPLSGEVTGAALGDLDGDGRSDLVLTLVNAQGEVRAGNGDATFAAPRALVLATDPTVRRPVVADLDGDGRLDVVSTSDNGFWVVRNPGGGAFAAPVLFHSELPNPFLAVDLDADGRLDLVDSLVEVRLNTSPVNRPPAAVDDAFTRRVWSSALRVPAPGVLANDTDPDGGPLTARLVGGPRHGTVTLAADGSFHYQARSVLAGEDSFTYQVVDAAGAVSPPAKVTIRVGF